MIFHPENDVMSTAYYVCPVCLNANSRLLIPLEANTMNPDHMISKGAVSSGYLVLVMETIKVNGASE